jgi:hypothetical protein
MAFDIVILAAVGPIWGGLERTILELKAHCLMRI